jgi:hypothetical protein
VTFRLSTYFAVFSLSASALVITRNPYVGAAYLIATVALLLPLFVFRVPSRFYFLLLFTSATLWASHMVRPLVWVFDLSVFMYGRIGQLTDQVVAASLIEIGILGFVLELGLVFGLIPFFMSDRRRTPAPRGNPLLVRGSTVIVGGLALLLFMRGFLLIGLNVGRKGIDVDPRFAFISQLIPDELVFAICVLFLAKYRHELSRFLLTAVTAILFAYTFLLLLGGSKAFLARLALALFIYYLASRGNFKVRVGRSVVIGAASLVLLILTFSLATFVRSAAKTTSGFGIEFITVIAKTAPQILQRERLKLAVDMVTRRLSGYDGFAAVGMYRDPRVEQAFSPSATASQAAARLLPGYRAGGMSQGKSISVYYAGLPVTLKHAGALGLFGAAKLMGGSLAALLLFGIGYVWGAFFRWSGRLESEDFGFLLQYIGAFAVLRWSLSGNFDDLIAEFVINLGQLAFYTIAAMLGYSIIKMIARPAVTPAQLIGEM